MTKAEDTGPHLPGTFSSLGHAPFVQPSSYLRPPMASHSERPIDREERQGLHPSQLESLGILRDPPLQIWRPQARGSGDQGTRGTDEANLGIAAEIIGAPGIAILPHVEQRAIRNFLKVRTSYDVLPLSFRLIIFDTSLSVKESLNILIQNGMWRPHALPANHPSERLEKETSADWKGNREFAGLLTTSDYINVIQYYFQNPAALDQIDQFRLDSLRGACFSLISPACSGDSNPNATGIPAEVEKALGVAPPETVSIDPERPLYEACRRMLESRARRIPLVTNDSQTDRSHVLSVITQYRILKFVAVNVNDTQKLRRPLGELLLGTYNNIATASMDTPVIDVIHILVERSISSVPILNSEGVVYNVFESVDVIALIRGGVYDDLSLTVGEVLKKRSPEFPGIYTCSLNDGLDTIFDTIRKSRVHRLVVVDEHFKLKGVITLSDILHYILLEGENDEV
ncbi:5'-AMP-activated protein kinase subunit gamma [Penicillium canariense]|uniref:5'-AMP-activated protein kinase subunit gamma n=1 Tax=Penicillium canariense TaxID=189055 RepID=A0A9W9LKB1_9EURO|nr:5'-AMP-activated protein kinase subunit gamma [Penicillium canariense]KAJ5160126.1 5'-AMP-activated protein kinase subunit gamma [Penicillium canariense]